MPISDNFREYCNVLSNIQIDSQSVEFVNGKLVDVKKRSMLQNFWSWFIHSISCTRVPRNAKLDEVASQIFTEAGKIKAEDKLSEEEKNSFKVAIEKLNKIIEKNNGKARTEEVNRLLKTIENIQKLEPVKNLTVQSAPQETSNEQPINQKPQELTPEPLPVVPSPVISKINTLQIALEKLKGIELLDSQIASEIAPLLLQLDGTVDLSPELTKILCRGFAGLEKEWIQSNALKLSPNMIRFIVEKSFQEYGGEIVSTLFETLTKEPVDKQRLSALIYGFPTFQSEYLYSEDITLYEWREKHQFPNGNQYNSWLLIKEDLQEKITPEISNSLEKNLSKETVRLFIRNFFGIVALEEEFPSKEEDFAKSFFARILTLVNSFSLENREFFLETLCFSTDIRHLIKLATQYHEETLLRKIFEVSPYKNNDHFFDNFVFLTLNGQLPFQDALIKVVLEHETKNRQRSLVLSLEASQIVAHIEQISPDLLENLNYGTLNQAIEMVVQQPNSNKRENALKIFANALEIRLGEKDPRSLDIEHEDSFTALFPFFNSSIQEYLLKDILINLTNDSNQWSSPSGRKILEVAFTLPTQRWFEVSKKIQNFSYKVELKELPAEQFAAFVNGQVGNHEFLREFFKDVFGEDETQKQTELLVHLDPSVFQFEDAASIDIDLWNHFFTLLRSCRRDQHTYDLFKSAAKSLFNDYSQFVEDSSKYIELFNNGEIDTALPVKEFPPVVCLLFAAVYERLDNYKEVVEKIDETQIEAFIKLFKPFYSNYTHDLTGLTNWLEKTQCNPSLLERCFKEVVEVSRVTPEDRVPAIETLSVEIQSKVEDFDIEVIFDILPMIKPEVAKKILEKRWDDIIQNNDEINEKIPYALILKMVDEQEKLCDILKGVLTHHQQNPQIVKSILDYFELYPWKLALLVIDGRYDAIFEKLSLNTYPKCKNITGGFWLVLPNSNNLKDDLQHLFNQVKEKNFKKAAQTILNLSMKSQLAKCIAYSQSDESICKELVYMNDGQVFALSCNKNLNTRLTHAINNGSQRRILGTRLKHFQDLIDAGRQFSIEY